MSATKAVHSEAVDSTEEPTTTDKEATNEEIPVEQISLTRKSLDCPEQVTAILKKSTNTEEPSDAASLEADPNTMQALLTGGMSPREEKENTMASTKPKTLVTDNSGDKANKVATKPSKLSSLIDTDSEDDSMEKVEHAGKDQTIVESNKAEMPENIESVDMDFARDGESIRSQKELSSPNANDVTGAPVRNHKISALIDSDLDESTDDKHLHGVDMKKHGKKSKVSTIIDSDSEDSDHDARELKKSHTSALIDSDSEVSEHEDLLAETNTLGFANGANEERVKKDKNKPMRFSAQKALDDIQNIQSEQQRLHREAHISVPYHVPKRHTLQEFLSRRTLNRPQRDKGSPAGVVMPSKNLKMTAEELAEYSKLLEERAKEATEFFKSESEDEDSFAMENANISAEDHQPTCKQPEHVDAAEDHQIATEVGESMTNNQTDVASSPTTSKVDIIEVIELPKLDLSTIHHTPTNRPDSVTPLSTPEPGVLATSSSKRSNRAESIRRLIREQNLVESPSLSGDPNMLIDLETGDLVTKTPTCADNLLRRLLATHKAKKAKAAESVSILSTENGKLEMSTAEVHLPEDTKLALDHKPGAAYFKLKEDLKTKIKQRRLEEIHKKHDEELEYEKCLADDDEDEEGMMEYEPHSKPSHRKIDNDETKMNVDDEENIDGDEDDEEDNNNDEDNADDDDEGDLDDDIDDDDKADNDDDNEEDDDEDDDNGDEEEGASSETEDKKAGEEATVRKHRIIKAFQDDSDDETDKTGLISRLSGIEAAVLTGGHTLFDNTQKPSSQSAVENELLVLCSGKFDMTQDVANTQCSMPTAAPVLSQIPMTQAGGQCEEDELLGLCSGVFEGLTPTGEPGQAVPESQISSSLAVQLPVDNMQSISKILSSDEENSTAVANLPNQVPTKRYKKKMKKRTTAQLSYSDDEDESKDPVVVLAREEYNDEASVVSDDPVEEVMEAETYVEYDSEENEVVVQMTKTECVEKAKKFLENEAELSESEWGSADEDERNLDQYDIELGDEDNFDRTKLQAELGKIHARKMLDEDIREVRKLQEMFFEDEETDGVGRQRQFRWKNAENGFSLADENGETKAAVQHDDSGDEDNEQMWRKLRYEREQTLRELATSSKSSPSSSTITTECSLTASCSGTEAFMVATTKKLKIITGGQATPKLVDVKPQFLIAQPRMPNMPFKRGSFLMSGKETLARLADLTKGGGGKDKNGADGGHGTAGTVSVKTIKPRNFVFATLTAEEHEQRKRKAVELQNSSSEHGIDYMKKRRIELSRKNCRIDQLL